MSKTKRLLSVTLAIAMIILSAFSAFAEDTETVVEPLSGTVAAGNVTVEPGVTKVTVPVTITFTNSTQVSPHGQFDIAAEGATLESATLTNFDNANFEPDEAVPDGAGSVDKSVYVEKEDVNTANGRVVVESDVSEGKQPSVSYVTVDVVLKFATALTAGQVIDVVISNIAATNLSEASWDGMVDVDGKITVEADVTHEAAADWSYDDTNHWHACVVEGCTEHIGENAYDYAGHDWNDGEVTVDPGIETSGVMTYTCACGATTTQEIPATGEFMVYTNVVYDLDNNKLTVSYAALTSEFLKVLSDHKANGNRVIELIADVDGTEFAFTISSLKSGAGTLTVSGFALPHINANVSVALRVTSGANGENVFDTNKYEIVIADYIAEQYNAGSYTEAEAAKVAAWLELNDVWAAGNEDIEITNADMPTGLMTYNSVTYSTETSKLTVSYAALSQDFLTVLSEHKANGDRVIELVADVNGTEFTFVLSSLKSGAGTLTVSGFSLSHFEGDVKLFLRVSSNAGASVKETNAVTVNLHNAISVAEGSDFAKAYVAYRNA